MSVPVSDYLSRPGQGNLATPETQGEADYGYWSSRLYGFQQDYVYVIQGDPGTPVKIGTACDPPNRLATLQTGNPQELRLLRVVPGTLIP